MANEQNLTPFNAMSREVAVEIQRKGGKARQKQIQERKTLAEELKVLLDTTNERGKSYNEGMAHAILRQALNGNVRAFEVIRDTIGEKPVEKQEIGGGLNINAGGLAQTLETISKLRKDKKDG